MPEITGGHTDPEKNLQYASDPSTSRMCPTMQSAGISRESQLQHALRCNQTSVNLVPSNRQTGAKSTSKVNVHVCENHQNPHF